MNVINMNKSAKNRLYAALAAAVFSAAIAAGVKAEAVSLWNDTANMVSDPRPSRAGDIVTVLVNEQTNTKDEATTDLQKSSSNSVSDGTGILKFIRALALDTSSESTGDSSVERKHTGRTTLSCLVTDVLPNGNLVIEGTRDIQTSEETLQLQLTGVIRPQDVNANNQVPSNLVANAELAIKGKGALTRTQKTGVITKILQTIF